MGEWSKTVGEFGEKTVEKFLNLIGWNNAPNNIEFTCLYPEEHSHSENRKTHGLDFYFTYKSPLIDGVLKNIHISVKYTSNKYPAYPSTLFKKYFEDLVYAIECFKISSKKRDIDSRFNGVDNIDDVGVLFWLSNDKETYDDLILKVAGAQTIPSYKVNSIMLVDNKRVEFIYRAIHFAKKTFPGAEIDFFYPSTGKNILPTTKQNCGKILPVEFINASILPLRIEELSNGKIHLFLFTIDTFCIADLKRLIGLSQDLSGSWASSICIAFPDYNDLTHQVEVKAAQTSFENKQVTNKLKVMSYYDTFKSV